MKTVLCYGDSNTYGYDPATGGRYDADTRWPCVLARILGDGYEVVEEGCNGRTTVFDDPNDDWKIGLDYIKGIVCSHRPVDILVIVVKAAVDTLVYKQKYAPEVIIVSPPEITEDVINGPFAGSFDEACCEKSKCLAKYYLSVASDLGVGFLNAAEYIRPSKEDGLHLTADAHKGLAEAVASMIVS